MAQLAKLRMLISLALGPAIAIALLFAFAGYALMGPNGLFAWGDYARQLHDSSAELKIVRAQRAEIANRVNLLNPRHVDPDMADEMIRKELNVAHPDEVVVPLR